ncbi:hypothetical protein DF3PA_60107 [Candidatus Defluviicoccus seviourii]|uniref:Lipoprotein SmpA/OmlA domain-containing protein n=2 Tax=root TaxID=1 RepID=A0A564WI47_9PROT|nr:hypothetical protein DF3PB_3160003 [uncultured Defluviicoccus sp.]VUX47628.1 hypothetical protein DF3PA_60107 [Candidatus Defluviicoccus seviourii]
MRRQRQRQEAPPYPAFTPPPTQRRALPGRGWPACAGHDDKGAHLFPKKHVMRGPRSLLVTVLVDKMRWTWAFIFQLVETFKMGANMRRLAIFGSILMLLGCATTHEGSELVDEQIQKIKIGVTKKDQIISLFGQPQQQGMGFITPVPPDTANPTYTNRISVERSNSPRDGETLIYVDATKVIKGFGLVDYSERSLNVYLVKGVVSECILASTRFGQEGSSRQEQRCGQPANH